MKSDVHNLNAAQRFGRSGPVAAPYNAHRKRVPSNTRQIEIQKGDTLGELAQGTGLSVEELAVLNSLSDPNSIRAGALLDVPADFNRGAVDHAIRQRSQPQAALLPPALPPALPSGMGEPGGVRAELEGPTLPPMNPPQMPGAPVEFPPMLAAPGMSPLPGVDIPQALSPGMSQDPRAMLELSQGGNAPLGPMPGPAMQDPRYAGGMNIDDMAHDVGRGAYGSAAMAAVPALAVGGGLAMGAGLAPLAAGGAVSSGASALGSGALSGLGSLGAGEIAAAGGLAGVGSAAGSYLGTGGPLPGAPAEAAPQQLLPPPQVTLPGAQPMIHPSSVTPMDMGNSDAIQIDPATGLPIPAGMTIEQYRQIVAAAHPPGAIQR